MLATAAMWLAVTALADGGVGLSEEVREFVRVAAPTVVLTHVQVIDGTGRPPLADQTIVVSGGRIQSVGPSGATPVRPGATTIELVGFTVIPGLVGMHDHLFSPTTGNSDPRGRFEHPAPLLTQLPFSFPRLYLAGGVTTIRTAGSIEPYTDLAVKRLIESGRMPGPRIHLTAPYLEGAGADYPQMHELSGPDEARRMVKYWAEVGFTSFKVYTHITRAELSAVIDEARRRGLKVIGHLCSIGFRDAAALGIDGIEHGFMTDTEFMAGRKTDECPTGDGPLKSRVELDMEGPAVRALIEELVKRKVAVTSTLAVAEPLLADHGFDRRAAEVMAPHAAVLFLNRRAQPPNPLRGENVRREMQFERAFVKAGGLLLAGADPTGSGGVLAGFANQRQFQLLVEAGFSVPEAVRICTNNGALFLGERDLGTLEPGKRADLVVVHGDLMARPADIEKVEIVFKDGVGYDSAKLIDSVRGVVGLK